jgi:hypothetical protein
VGHLVARKFQSSCNNQTAFGPLALGNRVVFPWSDALPASSPFDRKWTEFVDREKGLVTFQFGEDLNDLFDLGLIIRINTGEHDARLPPFESCAFDNRADQIT